MKEVRLFVQFLAKHKKVLLGLSLLVALFIMGGLAVRSGVGRTTKEALSVGLFVDMEDKQRGALHDIGSITVHDGLPFSERLHIFHVGEPITVTTTVLVFGKGTAQLEYSDPLNDYTLITLADAWSGQSVPMKEEWERARGIMGRHRMVVAVNHDFPFTHSFRIDEWFNLSGDRVYTLTLGRGVQLPDGSFSLITGNPVTFSVRKP